VGPKKKTTVSLLFHGCSMSKDESVAGSYINVKNIMFFYIFFKISVFYERKVLNSFLDVAALQSPPLCGSTL
jgi:hypothetical protein